MECLFSNYAHFQGIHHRGDDVTGRAICSKDDLPWNLVGRRWGIGTLIRGDSGAGKSEAALALIERGHSLVADDMVRVKLLSDHSPVGFCDEMSRGFMECRGIGIINAEELFGIRFVRLDKRIDLVVTFLEDSSEVEPDRTGLERKSFEILGVEVPHMEIPLRPGTRYGSLG